MTRTPRGSWLTSAWAQLSGAIAVWAYVVALHARNDGLWYADASRHAANGLFWWDFLESFSRQPLQYALAYYARYPVINPTAWPPVFYLLEGAAYRVFGVSPYVAKLLVLTTVLLGTGYMLAWLRRWVTPSAGWLALLLPLQPGFVVWGNAVMLNVPAAMFALAALYHWRRWLEAPRSWHFLPAMAGAAIAVLTYVSVAVIAFVMLAWVLLERRVPALLRPRPLLFGAIFLIPVVAWGALVLKWAPVHRSVAFSGGEFPLSHLESWTYYPTHATQLFSAMVLVTAAGALGVWWWRRSWRHEIQMEMTWLIVSYACFSLITLREARYILLLIPPTLSLAAITLAAGLRPIAVRLRRRPLPRLVPVVAIALVVVHVGLAAAVPVRDVRGFEEIAAFVKDTMPSGRVFYEGYYDGIFTFYMRRDDEHFHRAVTRGGKLLYTTKIQARFGLTQLVSTPADVTNVLMTKCGCRYFIVERQIANSEQDFAATRSLRISLNGPEFRRIRSFHVDTENVTDVDVYEPVAAVPQQTVVELKMSTLGDDADFRVAPIER